MKEETIAKKVQRQASKYKLRALTGHADRKRHDQVQADEQKWMVKAHHQLGWSAAKIGDVFDRDARTVRREIKGRKRKEEARVQQKPREEVSSEQRAAEREKIIRLIEAWMVEVGTYSPVQLLQVWIDKAHEDAQDQYYTTDDIKRLYTEAQQPHPLRVRPIFKVQSDPLFGLLKERFPTSDVWIASDAWFKQWISYMNAYYRMLTRAESVAAYAMNTVTAEANGRDIMGVDRIDGHDFPGFAKRRRVERLFAVFIICDLLACAIPGRPSSSYWAQLVNDLRKLRLKVNVELSSAIGVTPRGGWISGIADLFAESPNLPLEMTATFLDELAQIQLRQTKLIEALKELADNT